MAWRYQSLLPTPPPLPALACRQELGRLWVSCSPLGSTFISRVGSLASGRFLGHNTESPGDTFTIAPPLAQRGHPSLDSLGCLMTTVLFSVSWACVSNSRFPRSDVRSVGLPAGMPAWMRPLHSCGPRSRKESHSLGAPRSLSPLRVVGRMGLSLCVLQRRSVPSCEGAGVSACVCSW